MVNEQKNMEMDFSKLEEVKAGTKENTKVAVVNKGTSGQFHPEAYWTQMLVMDKNITQSELVARKSQPAIEIVCANGARMVMSYPANNRVHPKSNLFLWKRTYASYPSVGQEVQTKTDENGFARVVLEK